MAKIRPYRNVKKFFLDFYEKLEKKWSIFKKKVLKNLRKLSRKCKIKNTMIFSPWVPPPSQPHQLLICKFWIKKVLGSSENVKICKFWFLEFIWSSQTLAAHCYTNKNCVVYCVTHYTKNFMNLLGQKMIRKYFLGYKQSILTIFRKKIFV